MQRHFNPQGPTGLPPSRQHRCRTELIMPTDLQMPGYCYWCKVQIKAQYLLKTYQMLDFTTLESN